MKDAVLDWIRERLLTKRAAVIVLAGAGLVVDWATWLAHSCSR